jgi:PAS domain S-box-containing protein
MPTENARRAALAATLLVLTAGGLAVARAQGRTLAGADAGQPRGAAASPRGRTDEGRSIGMGTVVLLAALAAAGVTVLVAWKRAVNEKRAAVRAAERWQALAQRRMRETRWRGLADHAGSSVVCLEGHRIAGANLRAAQELGHADVARLVGVDFMTFVAAADRERLAACVEDRVAQGGGAATLVVRLATGDGRTFAAEATLTPARELEQAVVYVSWREAPLRQRAEAVLDTVAAEVPHGLVVTDGDGNLVWANRAVFERTGYEARRFSGRPLLPIVDPPARRVVIRALARARRGRAGGGVATLQCAGGEALTVEFKTARIGNGSPPFGILFVATETAAGEGGRDLGATARDRALSQLGTYLAHKVGNDFQALLGALEKLDREGEAPAPLAMARHLATGAADDLRRFVSLSRRDVGPLRPVHLWALIERWREGAAATLPAKVRLTTRREVADDRVLTDARQVLLWLEVSLAAARAAMELGGAIEVSLREGSAPGSVRLVFSDTGGVAEAGTAGAGEIFFSRRTAQALAEVIAAHHGGRTERGRAAGIAGRSWIEFAARLTSPWPKEEAPAGPREGAILIADDEEMVRTTLAAALRGVGYEVVEARNGLEAVESVQSSPERFALVVLDLVMPVMDGREALRRLRASAPKLQVVLCTGYDPVGDESLAASAVLIKPFSIAEFVAKVTELTAPGRPAGPGGTMNQ